MRKSIVLEKEKFRVVNIQLFQYGIIFGRQFRYLITRNFLAVRFVMYRIVSTPEQEFRIGKRHDDFCPELGQPIFLCHGWINFTGLYAVFQFFILAHDIINVLGSIHVNDCIKEFHCMGLEIDAADFPRPEQIRILSFIVSVCLSLVGIKRYVPIIRWQIDPDFRFFSREQNRICINMVSIT